MHPLGDGGHRLGSILLQEAQDAQIRIVEFGHGKFSHKDRSP